MARRYRVLLFDLFGTIVHFRTPRPGATGGGAFEWLRAPLAAARPDLSIEAFAAALIDVSRELSATRHPDHREVSSRERFRRALAQLGGDQRGAAALSLAHMAHINAQTELPVAHAPLLRELAPRYRIGLVSNFDHAPTARAILARHGVDGCFEVTVISDDVGVRKPHPSIFATALEALDATPGETLYVGDTPDDDIVGAYAAGLDVAWVNRRGAPPPDPAPTYTLTELAGLRRILVG
ncbi:MAG: HAD family hydrolase [Candidatus Binatia bacterium]